MTRRLRVLTDEHLPLDLVMGLRRHSFTVLRVEDEPRLRKRSPDENILDFAVEHDYAWLTRDVRAQRNLTAPLRRGEKNPGVIYWPQKHKHLSIGHLIRCIEILDEEPDPFARGVRYIKPSGV